MSKLLINEPPLQLLPSLAVKYGLHEAIIIQQLHYWLQDKRNGQEKDGERWIFNSYAEWHEQFPFLSTRAIQRAFLALEDTGVIKARQEGTNRRKFYAIDYERLDNSPSCQIGTMNVPERNDDSAELAHSSIAETTTETTSLAAQPHAARVNPEALLLSVRFVEFSGVEWKVPKSKSEWAAVNKLWLAPIRHMLEMANGQAIEILAEAIRRMRADRLTIANPGSVEKVFTSIYGERRSATSDPDAARLAAKRDELRRAGIIRE